MSIHVFLSHARWTNPGSLRNHPQLRQARARVSVRQPPHLYCACRIVSPIRHLCLTVPNYRKTPITVPKNRNERKKDPVRFVFLTGSGGIRCSIIPGYGSMNPHPTLVNSVTRPPLYRSILLSSTILTVNFSVPERTPVQSKTNVSPLL